MKARARCSFVAIFVVLLVIQLSSAAFAATTVNLLHEHVGATNPGFEDQSPNCGPNPTADFLWVFALVWIDQGTPPGVLTATFEKSGVITNSSPVLFGGGNMQRFYVYTDVADKVLGASATVSNAQSGDPRAPALKLSSVRQGCKPPPPVVLASTQVDLGGCTFTETSLTPASISVTPPGGATVTLRDKAGDIVASVSDETTRSLAAGTYSWTAAAAPGYTLEGASSGTLTAHSCVRVLPKVIKRPLAETGVSGLGILAAIGLALVGLGALMVSAESRPYVMGAAGFALMVAIGGLGIASVPLFLLPVVILARGRWVGLPAGFGQTTSWVRPTFGPVIAVARAGAWVPVFK